MKKRARYTISFLVVLLVMLTGCEKIDNRLVGHTKIYFFDTTRNTLVSEVLPEEFNKLQDNQEKVKYIIARLKENKSAVTTTLQAGPEMPIESQGIKDRVVTIHFSEAYRSLTTVEKIGMRASLVYSLTELDFIDGVDFYIEEAPLTTTTGKLIGTVYPSNINKDILDPNPATIPHTLSVYFANEEGYLVKEEHNVRVSNPNAVEKTLLEELIKGPNSDTLSRTVPSDMKVNDAKTTNGVCQIDISFDPKSKFFKNDRDKELMIYSIVNSLTSEPQIKKVVIFVNGKNDVAFTPDIDFTDTFERSESYISEEENLS